MDRRSYLATAGASLPLLGGCLQFSGGQGSSDRDAARFTPAEAPGDPADIGTVSTANGWTQVARDSKNTRFSGAEPLEGRSDIVWRAFGDQGTYQPVVGEDVYVTERRTDGAAVAVDDADGSVIWENRSLPPVRWPATVDGDSLFVVARTEANEVSLHSLDTGEGVEQWVRTRDVTASSADHLLGPAVRDGTVYLGTDTGVAAFDSASGDPDWTTTLGDHTVEYDGGGRVTVWSKPAVGANEVYVFDRNRAPRDGDLPVFALDAESGTRTWTARINLSDGWRPAVPYPVVGRKHVFAAVEQADGLGFEGTGASASALRICAVDRSSGDLAWEWKLRGSLSPLAYADGYLFVATWDGNAARLRVVDVENETVSWSHRTEVGRIGAPTVTPAHVFIAQGPELVALSTSDGAVAWKLSLKEALQRFEHPRSTMSVGDPVVADEALYVRIGGVDSTTKPTRLLAVR